MRVVAAIPAIGVLVGCVAGFYFPKIPAIVLTLTLTAAVVTAIVSLRRSAATLLVIAITLGFIAGGALVAAAAWHRAWRSSLRVTFESMARIDRRDAENAGRVLPEETGAATVLVGVLQADAAPSNGGVLLNVAAQWIGRARSGGTPLDAAANPVEGGVLLTVAGQLAIEQLPAWRAGRTIRAYAELRRPSRYLDSGVPDQEAALARRGISLVGSVKSGTLVDVVEKGSALAETAASVRAFARQAIATAVGRWSSRSAAIVTAIVIGDRSGLEPEIERSLQEAGTYHVIAISGGNIAILAGLALAAFRFAGVLGRGAMMSAIVALLAYAGLVAGGASVSRATFMAVVYFAGRALDLRGPPLNGLALAAGVLAVANPLAIADPAFLLTFGATTAILLVVPDRVFTAWPRPIAAAATLILASAAAEAALLPIGATLFSRVTFAGLALNLIAIPLMAVAQIAGMLVVPIALVSSRVAAACGVIAHLGAEGLVRSAGLVTLAPFTTWRVSPPSVLISGLYYGAAVMAWILWRRRSLVVGSLESVAAGRLRRGVTIAAFVFGAWVAVDPPSRFQSPARDRLRVTFLDVGQGDCAFIEFPSGDSMLVDAGGLGGRSAFDIGDRIVAPVVRRAGLRRLGTLVLTHGDADHVGGAAAILNEFRPWDVWEGIPVPPSLPLQQLNADARTVRSRWTRVRDGDQIETGDVRILVRHPRPADWERQDVRNDDSVVLEIVWREVSIVMTGDIVAEVEQSLIAQFAPAPLRVIKVPHHGSLTSSSERFVRALSPRVAVISVGRSNTFGHPAPAVLRRYADVGAEIFRTDRDGAIVLDTDGHSLEINSYTGHRALIKPLHQGTKPTKAHEG